MLTSIDIATATVLRNLMIEKDYDSALDNMRILAMTPGDEEIMTLAEAHIKQTERHRQSMKVVRGYTVADTLRISISEIEFLKTRAFDLYWQLRKKLKEKGYLRWSSLLNDKTFQALESKVAEENP
jgi:hypothetical protein